MAVRKKKYDSKTIENFYLLLLEAADQAGGKEGVLNYFRQQALDHPQIFLGLLAKILAMKTTERHDETVQVTKIEIIAPQKKHRTNRNTT